MQSEVPIGWKVHVWSEQVPYIVGKSLVPYESIPVANSVEQFVTNRSHKRCTVIGQAESGRSAVTCDDGDYIELSESNLPSGASTIVLVKDHKECEVIDISSSGVASLECEDGEVVTLNQPLKTGQIILIPGKSAKLISTANRLYDRINEFKISATAANDQQLTDVYHPEVYRARSATQSMIPTKTGAAAAIGEVLPELKGRLDGLAVRVPTINVSLVDLTFNAGRETSVEEVNELIRSAADGSLKEVLSYNEKPLVSVDFNHIAFSCNFDATQTRVNGSLVKVMAWYDNEWGFSNRMLDNTLVLLGAIAEQEDAA
jgi:hypothetical protein